MVSKVLSLEAREKIDEEDLYKRALELLAKYLPECPVRPVSVTWRSMSERWGSCTTVERSIRISDRLNGAPGYVLDYLLVHELIHLMIADHGPDFEALLARFELGKEASAYLEGYEAGVRAGN
jgi:predicted metal-dependent hydrolase